MNSRREIGDLCRRKIFPNNSHYRRGFFLFLPLFPWTIEPSIFKSAIYPDIICFSIWFFFFLVHCEVSWLPAVMINQLALIKRVGWEKWLGFLSKLKKQNKKNWEIFLREFIGVLGSVDGRRRRGDLHTNGFNRWKLSGQVQTW